MPSEHLATTTLNIPSALWSESAFPAFAVSDQNRVLDINPAMRAMLLPDHSFIPGSLGRWVGLGQVAHFSDWMVKHETAPGSWPITMQFPDFSGQVCWFEVLLWEEIRIIRGRKSGKKRADDHEPIDYDLMDHYGRAVSHDLRGPVRQIRMFTQKIQEYAPKFRSEELLQDLNTIFASSSVLLSRVEAMARLLKLEAVSPNFRSIPLDKAVRIVLQNHHMMLQQRKAEIAVGDLPTILGNPEWIQAILMKLVSNAIKHTPDSQPIRIRIGTSQHPSCLSVFVSDKGVGVSTNQIQQIFRVFDQVHAEDTGLATGSGIGLVAARRLAQRMGMDLQVSGQPGEGARFDLIIPEQLVTTQTS